ncbi:MAG TPA: Ig-like domain-containing protein [Solirubrobacteraceae bacterium]|nr:Ig-like domain-containing protein [Solirubrobacteraceae bacterium]
MALSLGAAVAAADAGASMLAVTLAGTGAGTVTSDPAGLTCAGATCTGSFDPATPTVLVTEVPAAGNGFGGFGGGDCTATTATTCTVSLATDAQATATFDAPPALTVTAPADATDYAQALVPPAAFACPSPGVIVTCALTVDGGAPITSGGPLPATPGAHTFTVTALAGDGGSASQSGTYTVFPIPTCNDINATTNEGTRVRLRPACADPHASSIVFTLARPAHGTITTNAQGAIFYTPGAGFSGTDSFVYHGTSADGVSAARTVTVHVLAPPTAQIVSPAAGLVYTVSQSVPTRFSCADDPAGRGLRSCIDSGGASHGTGTLDTAGEGPHTYSVTATSADGQTGRATIAYTVVGRAPEVVIAAPVNNAAYLWTAIPAADFTCHAGVGSTIQSCKATIGGQPISDHQALPNAFGAHVLTVTATDADGLTSTASATYTSTVSTVALPPVEIRSPRQGGTYRLGQAVAARYSCAATGTGPALTSCVGTVRARHRIDTTTLGTHTFTVSATNADGNSTTEAVTYRVVHTTNHFTVVRLSATPSGAARLALKLPGPGSVRVVATAWNTAGRASRRHIAYGTAAVSARRGGALTLVVAPTAAGRALLRTKGARPVIALAVTYTPTGARPRLVHPARLRLRR